MNSNIERHRPAGGRAEEGRGRTGGRSKENPLSDAVYLLQNENDVLRMKNDEMSVRVRELRTQVQMSGDGVALRESEVESLRARIRNTAYKEDIEIENEKRLLEEKLALLHSDEDALLRKIQEAREAALIEEQKMGDIQEGRKGLEMDILSMRAQNQGTKIILRNLEQQNEQLRAENEQLVSKRKVYEPRERDLSIDIEQRIRLIKNQQHNLRTLRLYETSKLIGSLLSILHQRKLRTHFARVASHSLQSKLAKKKIFALSLIRKRYLLFIKNGVLQRLRQGFQPLQEQETARRIIAQTRKRRARAIVWRKWRRAAKEAQYRTIRRFEFQNLMEKLAESFARCNLYAAFNTLKHHRDNPLRQRAAITVERVFGCFMRRAKMHFLSSLRAAQNQYQLGLEIDASSKEQTEMLVSSLYFTAWAKLTKSHRIENKSLKRRYFLQLKKLLALKRRRVLGEMLMNTNQRINNVDRESKVFTRLKKEALQSRIHSMNEEHFTLQEKSKAVEQDLTAMRQEKKELYHQLALLKVSQYLKRKVQRAFDLWRLRKQQSKVILTIMNMLESKKAFDKNFAFSKILKKRFFMLKKSIRDKIQSCEFSYNYLLDENRHIKEVLDKKQHELEKTKFTTIIKRIINNQKQAKLAFFHRFLRNGFKYWKFRKTVQRIDKMVDKKVKIVFMWLLKQNISAIRHETRIEAFVEEKEQAIHTALLRRALAGFSSNVARQRRFRRVIGGIFQRNLQLDYYCAFGKIRNEEHLHNRGELQEEIDYLRGEVEKRNAVAATEEQTARILVTRLKQKQEIFQERKVLTLFQFFSRSVLLKVGGYITRWRAKVQREKRVTSFAEILERKSRILLKNKFLLAITKQNEDHSLGELTHKLQKYQGEYDTMAHDLEKFVAHSDQESSRMRGENEVSRREGERLEKKTDFMTGIKLKSFGLSWGKKLLGFVFKNWRQQTDLFINTWGDLEQRFSQRIKRETFHHFAKEMSFLLQNDRIRRNLSRIYHTGYLHNVGLGFRTWRVVYFNKKQQMWTEEEKTQMRRFEGLEGKYRYAVSRHNRQVDFRLFDALNRSVFNEWRKYAEANARNKQKGTHLQQWLMKGVNAEFIHLLKSRVAHKIAFKERLRAFKARWNEIRIRAFMRETSSQKTRRSSFQRLFVNKFCPFLRYKLFGEFFSHLKNYGNMRDQQRLSDRTDRIQKVIETFQKKRKSILNCNLRLWRRNEYEMRIERTLMRRLTKNAMNWRVRDLFYTWKLETEAKRVKIMHQEEGEVKKRKIEIQRLKVFLEDFKKEKGLLLQDDAGQLVVSPRFQQKKEQQIKKDNNFRYRFISRLILSMNGYSAPVKAFNNLKMYMLVREKYRRHARIVRNNLRKPDLFYAFKIWHKATADFNKTFETMERKSLIKILNRQKDKMEMEYTKKVTLEERIHSEMGVHRVLAYQEDRKEKLSAHVFLKNLRKVQRYAMFTWKHRVSQMKEAELEHLEDMGGSKIASLEEEVNELVELERELRENNAKLEMAVQEAVEIAEMVKRITEERDILSGLLEEKEFTCESLQEENEELNAKLHLAQKEAMNLLILSGNKL